MQRRHRGFHLLGILLLVGMLWSTSSAGAQVSRERERPIRPERPNQEVVQPVEEIKGVEEEGSLEEKDEVGVELEEDGDTQMNEHMGEGEKRKQIAQDSIPPGDSNNTESESSDREKPETAISNRVISGLNDARARGVEKVEVFSKVRGREVALENVFERTPVNLLNSVAGAVAEYDQRLFDTEEYDVKSVREYKNWRLLSVGVAEIPEEVRKMIELGEITEWATPMHSVIARQRPNGTWESALQGTREHDELIYQTPDEWMNSEVKSIFADTPEVQIMMASVAEEDKVNYKLPWPKDVTWSLVNFGTVEVIENGKKVSKSTPWHRDLYSTNNSVYRNCDGLAYCALDFSIATTNSDNRRLLSSADGVITNVCTAGTVSRNVDVRHADGTIFSYWHVDKNHFEEGITKDLSIMQGTVFGELRVGSFAYDKCGTATQNNAHVHWKLPTGKKHVIDGRTFEYVYGGNPGAGVTFTSSNVPVKKCEKPPAVSHWNIIESCYVNSHEAVSQQHNMVVSDSATLTITASGSVDVNFVSQKLVIQNGSKVVVKKDGKLY